MDLKQVINDRNKYLREYSDSSSVAKYVSKTAGKGIKYILDNIYGPLYSKIIDSIWSDEGNRRELRVLEYGCGAGMNLIHIFKLVKLKGITIVEMIGVDFSLPLIEAAENEKNQNIPPEDRKKINFFEASNESLLDDLSKKLSRDRIQLCNSFDLIVGVNTFRYAVRLEKQNECANDIASLLVSGGYSIMIDMNDKFPLFRSKIREGLNASKTFTYLPTLEEYTIPFKLANLEIVQSKHFCWIPHSAGRTVLNAARILTPLLNLLVPDYAMRSLVVSKKR